jgi:hypothetical protein
VGKGEEIRMVEEDREKKGNGVRGYTNSMIN